MVDALGFGYAAIIALGGVMGYVKAGSIMSLAMGLIFGALSAIGAYQLSQNENSYTLLLFCSAFLTAMMSYRAVQSGKLMPAGVVALLSLMMVVRLALRIFK